MPKKGIVRLELGRCNLRLNPANRYHPAELDELAEMMQDELEDMQDSDFEDAMREHRRQSSWMPTSADILASHNVVLQHVSNAPQHAALPERSAPEQNAYNAEKAKGILERLERKMRAQ